MDMIEACVVGIVVAIVCHELSAWTDFVSKRVCKLAIRFCPPHLRGRLEEEWPAHLDELPGKVGKILAAFGFLVAAGALQLDSLVKSQKSKQALETALTRFTGFISVFLFGPLLIFIAIALFFEGHGNVFKSVMLTSSDGNRKYEGIIFDTRNKFWKRSILRQYLRRRELHKLPIMFSFLRGSARISLRDLKKALKSFFGS